jgi:hypothetical protein
MPQPALTLRLTSALATMLLGSVSVQIARADGETAPAVPVASAPAWEEPPPPRHFKYDNVPRPASASRARAEDHTAPAERAATQKDPFRAGMGSVTGVAGLFTPIGEIGVEGQLSLARFFVLSAGAGLGAWGPQVAVMPRFRLVDGNWAGGLGAGASYGRYGWFENWLPDTCKQDCAHKTGNLAWGNAEAFAEFRRGRLVVRSFVGVGVAINPEALVCDRTIGESSYSHCLRGHADDGKPTALPYAGSSVGFSFDLLGG